jgi:hypothetical protein
MSAQIEFVVRVRDLRNATHQLTVNRGSGKQIDWVDLLVSECIATLRAVGTSTEIPVNGIHPGTARLPILLFEKVAKIAKTYKARETTVTIWEGLIKIGGWQTRDPDISLGVLPNLAVDLPVNASFLDTLALASVLSPGAAREQGLDRRIAEALQGKEAAIDRATRALEPLSIDRDAITAFVEDQIVKAGERLRNAQGEHLWYG